MTQQTRPSVKTLEAAMLAELRARALAGDITAARILLGGRRVMAKARTSPIAGPARRDVAALAKPEAFDRWNAGVRAAEPGENVITMYEVIGEDWWTGGGVTVSKVDQQLNALGAATDVEIHINSPGGDMFEGIAIYNRLLSHKGQVTVKVMGLAASAASIIAMAGDEILIGPASFFMIHNCWVLIAGDRNAMAETASWLAPFDAAMAGVYAAKSGQKATDVAGWMDAETWMNGDLALERGFATALLNADDIAEDAAVTSKARDTNAVRQAEVNLCRAGATRAEARGLIDKIKGVPDAALETTTSGVRDLSWLGAAAQLSQSLRA